jgi:hypothetical protein
MRSAASLRGLNAALRRVNTRDGVSLFPLVKTMIDFLYIAGTICFFALMIVYIRGCDKLGRSAANKEQD